MNSFPAKYSILDSTVRDRQNGTAMQTLKLLFTGLSVVFLLSGCAASKGTGASTADDPNTITSDEIQETDYVDLNELIARRVPGIRISQSSTGGITVVIRGVNSFTGDNSPLYVVDGIPIEPGRDGSLPGVMISEIEEIRVYKDSAQTARWGMRGGNGVIEVKTKK